MKYKISNNEIASLCMELSLLFHAGVGTADALSLLSEDGMQTKLLTSLAKRVDEGATLSAALRESKAFPIYVCGLIEVGERTGRIEEALNSLSWYYEERVRLNRRLRSAVMYPMVMLALMLMVIGVLLVKVLPIFDDVYASLGGELTGAAAWLLGLGQRLENMMPVLFIILGVVVVLGVLLSVIRPLRTAVVKLWQLIRGDRGISRKLNNARLAQAMAMAMACGLPVEEAVALSANLVEGGGHKRCQKCQARLENGENLGLSLRLSGLMPARQCRLLELGERNGAGDAAMEKIARDLGEEGNAALDTLVGAVEPALVLVCSVLVGLILLSVMLPLMNIMAAIG
jgi:type IV pilus assembly protein PilC